MKKILLTYPVPEMCVEPYREQFSLTIPENKLTEEQILEMIPEYEGLFLIGSRCGREILEAGVRLEAVGNFGVGYDNVDWKAATGRGIAVVNTPTQVTEATAEHCVALIMAVMRQTSYYDRFVRAGNWDVPPFTDRCTLIAGSILGIIGFGRIGRRICRKAQGLGMQVMYYDKYRISPEEEQEYQVTYREMDDLLSSCDCISLNMPYTPENYHLIDSDSFDKMKSTSYLVNGERGPVVDEKALVEALRQGKIRGAGLDVFDCEPRISPELMVMENVVLTPHIASAAFSTRIGMAREAMDGITAVLRGERPYNVINPQIFHVKEDKN